MIIGFLKPSESFINHSFKFFYIDNLLNYRSIIISFRRIFTRFGNRNNCCIMPIFWKFTSSPNVIKYIQKGFKRILWEMFKHLIVDLIRTESCDS